MEDGKRAIVSRLEVALRAADAAGRVVMRWFNNPALPTETKRDGSPVTAADREAERVIRQVIASAFPADSVLGEEEGAAGGVGGGGYRWIVDPIDGTASFVCGVPLFGTMIGVQESGPEGRMVAGVISMPALGERVHAWRGGGAWHVRGPGEQARAARVSRVGLLREGVLATTSIDYYRKAGLEPAYAELCRAAKWSRGWSDCYAFVLLATGRVDAVVEPVVHPWDIAAAEVIVAEAGGEATDFAGGRALEAGCCVATNGLVHREVLGMLAASTHARGGL